MRLQRKAWQQAQPTLDPARFVFIKAMLSEPDITMEDVAKRLRIAPHLLRYIAIYRGQGSDSGGRAMLTPVVYLES